MTAIAASRKWSIKRCLLGKRVIPTISIALLPAFIAAIGAYFGAWNEAGEAFSDFGEYTAPLCLYFVLPMLCMFSVLPTVGELYEGGAIGYFWTRPCPRWQPLIGIHQGATISLLLLTGLGVITSAVLMGFADPSEELTAIDWASRAVGLWGVMIVGGFAYCAICLFLAVWSKRSALWSIGLLVGWGAIVGALPGSLRNTSPHRYLFGLLRDWCNIENTWSGFFIPDANPPSTLLSLVVLVGTCIFFLVLAQAAAKQRDVL